VSTSRTVEPVTAVFALGVGKPLPLFALGALTIHFAVGDVILKDQPAFCTHLGIATMVRRFTTWRRTDIDGMTRVAPVLAAGHFLTNRAFFHMNTSIKPISDITRRSRPLTETAPLLTKIIISLQNFQSVVGGLYPKAPKTFGRHHKKKKPGLQGPAFWFIAGVKISRP
jgi:hypothetical protein